MSLPRWTIHVSLLVTLAVFAFASLAPVDALWGINHGQYFPTILTLVLILITTILVASSIGKHEDTGVDSAVDKLAAFFWSDSPVPRWGFALGFVVLAFFVRVETHFLGDGYGWLWNFSSEYYYLHKWTEPIAMHTVRALQWALGGFNQDTSLLAFRIISFTSGFIVILNLFAIFGRLCESASLRILGMVTFIFSGVVLQFFGYVEFYAPLWAAMTAFFRVSLTYFEKRTGFWRVILIFLLSSAFHMQTLYLSGAVLLLFCDKYWIKFDSPGFAKKFYTILGILGALFALTLVWLYTTEIRLETIFLPLFEGRPQKPDYSVFSQMHLLDILNLAILIFPGALGLLLLSSFGKNSAARDIREHFWILSSIGALVFLLIIDPVIGMARDWDLMSATLLPPALWMFYRFDVRKVFLNGHAILSYSLVCILLTGTFLSASVDATSSQTRYHSLLRYYGSDSRSGWVILANELERNSEHSLLKEVEQEMAQLFPDDTLINQTLDLISSGQFQVALQAARLLYDKDPYNILYLQLLGNCLGNIGRIDSSIFYYSKAVKMSPFNTGLMVELGEVYLKNAMFEEALSVLQAARRMDPLNETFNEGVGMAFLRLGQVDSTSFIAETLLERDSLSVSGHLLALMVAVEAGNITTAKHHYELFKQTGYERSSYQSILEYYRDVAK